MVLVGFKPDLEDQLVSFNALTLLVWFGHLACKNRPRNDLLCVEWDVKHYTLTHSIFKFIDLCGHACSAWMITAWLSINTAITVSTPFSVTKHLKRAFYAIFLLANVNEIFLLANPTAVTTTLLQIH